MSMEEYADRELMEVGCTDSSNIEATLNVSLMSASCVR